MVRFKANAPPEDMPEATLGADAAGGLAITTVLKQAGLAPSVSEAVRNIEQGGVRVDSGKVADRALRLGLGTLRDPGRQAQVGRA